MKILSVVGARPQFVKLAPVAHAAAAADVEHAIVHTGQHYDPMLSDVFFRDLGIPAPDRHLGVGSGGHGAQTGQILAAMDDAITELAPDVVLVYGDTNSTLAGALSAVKLHVPVAHLEAGLRSFNRAMPEEINRVLTDHAADLCLAPTAVAVEHLAAEGLAGSTVLVGDVMTDVLLEVRERALADTSAVDAVLAAAGLARGEFLVATLHRAENTDDPARLRAIAAELMALPVPVLLLAHPRLVARSAEAGVEWSGAVRLHAPLAYPELVGAVLASRGVVTDSGGLQKEAFLLGVPCTTVRTETEWVETVELGWNVLVDPRDPSGTGGGTSLGAAASRPAPAPTEATPYGDGHAAPRTIEALRALVERRA